MVEADKVRLRRIDQLLWTRNYAALEVLTLQEMPRDLISEKCLDTARAMRLPVTVIYLASLSAENLTYTAPFERWLAVYQSLSRGVETDALGLLPSRDPLRVVTQHLLPGNSVAAVELRRCKGSVAIWLQALELAFDHSRFDLVLLILGKLVKKKLEIQDWLLIATSMANRQDTIKNGQADASLGQAYLKIRQQLRGPQVGLVKVRSRLSLSASDSFFLANEHVLSVQAAQLATDPAHRASAAFNTARAHCYLHDLPVSLEWLDRQLALTCEASIELSPSSLAEFISADAARALVDMQNALAAADQKVFLVSGTLLGFAREGKILDHDKDLDVGVIGLDQQFDVVQVILQSRQFQIDLSRLSIDKVYQIGLRHIETQVSIDLFVYHPEGGKLVTGVQSNFGYVQKFAFTPFELKLVSFMGIDFYVPANVELNLTENFGGWKNSDPDYISHLESPSIIDVGGLVFQVVGRLSALESIRDKKHERLARVIDIMTLHRQREGGMSEETLSVLRTELARYRSTAVAELPGSTRV